MKQFSPISWSLLSVAVIAGFLGPLTAFAAAGVAPTLGVAAAYSVYGHTGLTNTGVGTHVWGNVGDNNVGHPGLIGSQVDGAIDAGAGVEAAFLSAYGQLTGQAGTPQSLSGTPTIVPGVYDIGATPLNGIVTLDGSGVYIFKSSSSINATGSAQMNLINGASACNVFWQIPDSMTIDPGAHIEGTILASTQLISFGTGASLKGRALSYTAAVTMDTNTITQPACVAQGGESASTIGSITVIKMVVNDNGGTKKVSDFPLFVDGVSVTSGNANSFQASNTPYAITETSDTHYATSFSGDCDATGHVLLTPGDQKVCIMTNNDIGAPVVTPPVPPLIDVVKVPSPLALPNGSGQVTYDYTLKNAGTVPVLDVTMSDDSCSPVSLVSGDVNGDRKLDLNETWNYHCFVTLNATHTNIVTATGWANGLMATDLATATVVVGSSLVPPLIHVTKIPSPLALRNGGGLVTYTEKITNPGTVPLNNVTLNDDKCTPMKFISGDTNNDSKLDSTETWTYTCKSVLKATTTNTAVATGQANGFTVRDFAIATVVVAAPVPKLPNTGFGPDEKTSSWIAAALLSAIATFSVLFIARKKQSR